MAAGAGLTETITFDDLLALPLPFDAGVYGVGQQSLMAAHRRTYGAATLPRPASWAGPLESLVIAQGTVVPRKQGCALAGWVHAALLHRSRADR